MNAFVNAHVIQSIGTLTEAKTKAQVWLGLHSYFDELMCIATSADLAISANTMHQYAISPVALKTMMHMLSYDLDRGPILVYPDAMEARVHMSSLSAQTPSQTTKLGIDSPPSIITWMSKSWYHHNYLSVSDSLHGLLKPILSHMGTLANCM